MVPAGRIGQKMEKKEQKGQRNAQIMGSAASSSQRAMKQKWQVSYVRCLFVQEVAFVWQESTIKWKSNMEKAGRW